MPTLAEYFEIEARAQLARMDELLQAESPDAAALQRVARELRGTAQMARVERVHRVAQMLEQAAGAVVAGRAAWDPALIAQARSTAEDLHALVELAEPENALDTRAETAVQRWRDAGIELPASNVGPLRSAPTGGAYRAYVADEVEGVANALEEGVQELSADAMNREPLKAILRRQRALLGSARLEDIPVVAEILRAVEDLTRVIARLDVGVKQEWLDIFRIAREGLRGAIEPLRRDENPPASTALARLRHMRAELIERYGTGEPVNAEATAQEGLMPARPAAAVDAAATASVGAPSGAASDIVSIDELQYRGDAAVQRALEVRARIQGAVVATPEVRAALDELVDLVRLARE